MATYARLLLSGSSNGQVIPVAATATPGTLIHTAVAGDGAFDEVYVWAANVTGSPATLTIEWGGVADPSCHLVKQFSIPAHSGPQAVLAGQNLNGGLVAQAFSGTANAINLSGFVNRISQ